MEIFYLKIPLTSGVLMMHLCMHSQTSCSRRTRTDLCTGYVVTCGQQKCGSGLEPAAIEKYTTLALDVSRGRVSCYFSTPSLAYFQQTTAGTGTLRLWVGGPLGIEFCGQLFFLNWILRLSVSDGGHDEFENRTDILGGFWIKACWIPTSVQQLWFRHSISNKRNKGGLRPRYLS